MKTLFALMILSFLVILGSVFIGPAESITAGDIIRWVTGDDTETFSEIKREMVRTVVIDIRLARILLAFLVGTALSASGASLQAMFRNPLVDPFILGISSGAAAGAALALATGFASVQLSAFIFAAIAVALSSSLAGIRNNVPTIALVLAGVVISGIFTAVLTIIQFLSDPFRLQTIVHWTMGSMQTASWEKIESAVLPIAGGSAVLLLWGWRLNLLSLGDEEVIGAGLRPGRERLIILAAATAATAAAVAVAGIIGFYGLIIPHLMRMTIGADNRKLIPASALAGGAFLVLIDDLARSLTAFEIPIGVFTILLGAPFFLLLLRTSKIGWQE